MKTRLLKSAIAMVIAGWISNASAQNIELGVPEYGGNGCPAGSAASILSPDGTKLTVLYDQFLVEAGASSGKLVDRKSCNLAIPLRVPGGYSVSIIKVDYRGYTYIPRGASVTLESEYFFAGGRGPRLSSNFRGPKDDNYLVTDNLIATAQTWSPCGANTTLRINSNLRALANTRTREDVLATLDSTDVDTNVIYHLQLKRCR